MTEKSTRLIHHPYRPPAGFESPQVAVHKASTIVFPSVAAIRQRDWIHKQGYTYGLHGTPTTFTLEERIATLEGGRHCILVPSGLASVAHVGLSLLKTGDDVLLPENVYGPSKALAQGELANFGITHQFYDPMDPADLAARIGPRTRLVWLEAPGSVSMEFPPLVALARLCRERGVTSALDTTWPAGIAFNAFELAPGVGVDVVAQALTKYPSGGGDVLMGAVVVRDDALHERLQRTHMRLGWGVSGNDAELVLRSLPSMALRYRAADHSARAIASWLGQREEIAQVLHPAFPGSPGHENWLEVCGADGQAAGLFSVLFDGRYTQAQVDRFCESLQLFKLGYSWASHLSLVVPYEMRTLRRHWEPAGGLVRFSIGLEDTDDLIADLDQALKALG
ncbi:MULTISPECIES: PLP-dependent transferase [Ramlibacter]|uniref:PLP-dependent transferase n=1 Tax=Ramlibacter aquaticus TaxID=2780094 RepID=A0ABR9SIA9_9BURK|nr:MULTISPECIES: PLP-dependent transferase [Ramlibacter]MBE7942099.1 PLP-dependent transferase [Ramlibacter aquaticus]